MSPHTVTLLNRILHLKDTVSRCFRILRNYSKSTRSISCCQGCSQKIQLASIDNRMLLESLLNWANCWQGRQKLEDQQHLECKVHNIVCLFRIESDSNESYLNFHSNLYKKCNLCLFDVCNNFQSSVKKHFHSGSCTVLLRKPFYPC